MVKVGRLRENVGGGIKKEKSPVFGPESSLHSSRASPSSGSDCGMVECSSCSLRQRVQYGSPGDYEMVDEIAVEAL